jgi:hypothetical protein
LEARPLTPWRPAAPQPGSALDTAPPKRQAVLETALHMEAAARAVLETALHLEAPVRALDTALLRSRSRTE